MIDFFHTVMVAQTDFFRACLLAAGELIGWLAAGLGLAVLGCFVYFNLSSALRRQERARCFIDLLEVGLKQGRTLEQTVMTLSQSREQILGVYFHLAAAYLELGHRFIAALDMAPRFLPRRVVAMLKVGEEIGSIQKVFPACRQTLRDGTSASQAAANNLIVFLFVPPLGIGLLWMFNIWVLPKFRDIGRDMLVQMPSWPEQFFAWSNLLAGAVLFFWILFAIAAFSETGGWRLLDRLGLWPLTHRLSFWIPWRRKRMLRDFSAMLALLLDAEAPEQKAVLLAAAGTGNRVFHARAGRVVRDLQQGARLTDAVQWIDDAGEFRWRLRNATQPPVAFCAALAGWHEALEAGAFQQQQAASQTITAGFVLLNGAMVALFAAGVFKMLIAIIDEAAL